MEGKPVQILRPIARIILSILIIPALCSNGLAQATQAPAPQTAAPAATLRANANLVLVDVVVTDHGTPVHNLDRTHFHVLEDGHQQPIASFDEHKSAATETAATSTTAPMPALPPHTFTNVPNYPEASAVNVLLLDGLNTPLSSQMNVRRQMIQFLGNVPAGTPLAIFTLSSKLRMVEGFTTHAAELTKVLESPKGSPLQSVILDSQTDQAVDSVIGDMANMTGGATQPDAGGVTALSTLQQFEADQAAFQTDMRVQMTLEAMQQLARYLAAIPGRKNVIWFSGSFPIALAPDSTLDNSFEAMRNYSDDIRDTAELLAASRVAVYPVDARGLMTLPAYDASYSPTSNLVSANSGGGRSRSRGRATANRPSTAADNQKATEQNMAEHATMQQLAEQTGGQEFFNTNGLKEAIATAVSNGSSYYTIGFIPGSNPLDGQFRKIQVNLDSRDLKLAYRHGYYADAPDKATEHTPGATSMIVAAMLHGAPPSTQIPFEARVLPASDPLVRGTAIPAGPAGELTPSLKPPLERLVVDLKIDPRGLVFASTPDGAIHTRAEFMLVAYDADGRRVNYVDHGFQINLKSGQMSKTMQDGIKIRLPIDLPAGQFSLRIAVHDLAAARAGSVEVPVTVSAANM